ANRFATLSFEKRRTVARDADCYPVFVLLSLRNEPGQREPATIVVGESIETAIPHSQLAKQAHLAIGIVGVLVYRPVSERIDTAAAVTTRRQPVRTDSRQIVECRRVIPAAEGDLARVSATAVSTDAELPGARLLRAERPI